MKSRADSSNSNETVHGVIKERSFGGSRGTSAQVIQAVTQMTTAAELKLLNQSSSVQIAATKKVHYAEVKDGNSKRERRRTPYISEASAVSFGPSKSEVRKICPTLASAPPPSSEIVELVSMCNDLSREGRLAAKCIRDMTTNIAPLTTANKEKQLEKLCKNPSTLSAVADMNGSSRFFSVFSALIFRSGKETAKKATTILGSHQVTAMVTTTVANTSLEIAITKGNDKKKQSFFLPLATIFAATLIYDRAGLSGAGRGRVILMVATFDKVGAVSGAILRISRSELPAVKSLLRSDVLRKCTISTSARPAKGQTNIRAALLYQIVNTASLPDFQTRTRTATSTNVATADLEYPASENWHDCLLHDELSQDPTTDTILASLANSVGNVPSSSLEEKVIEGVATTTDIEPLEHREKLAYGQSAGALVAVTRRTDGEEALILASVVETYSPTALTPKGRPKTVKVVPRGQGNLQGNAFKALLKDVCVLPTARPNVKKGDLVMALWYLADPETGDYDGYGEYSKVKVVTSNQHGVTVRWGDGFADEMLDWSMVFAKYDEDDGEDIVEDQAE